MPSSPVLFDKRSHANDVPRLRHANADRFSAWLHGIDGSLPSWEEKVLSQAEVTYPGGSKSRVNKAGAAVRLGSASGEDLACIDIWRAAHQPVINTFQAMLRSRAKAASAVVGQRHKRKITIFDKLHRLPKMELARMDDIAGCRLIFIKTEDLCKFRESLHFAKFNHRLRNEKNKYDYIRSPKNTGYRGIHDIYEYKVLSDKTSKSNGLYVELQYRTSVQHAWATTNEIIGFVTESQPKFQKGDTRYQSIMRLTNEILARSFENSRSCLPDLADKEVVQQFLDLDSDLGFMNLLGSLNSASSGKTKATNIILMMKDGKPLEVKSFRYAPEALRNLFRLEAENPGIDVVLVRGNTSEDVRIAFKNYFNDATEFIRLVEDGCERLSGKSVIKTPKPALLKE